MTFRNSPLEHIKLTRRGFTLIELLTVVATIAILAGIAVPNFLEAQVRSKISRNRNDMVSVSYALAAYRADTGRYPPNGPDVRPFLRACAAPGVEAVDASNVPTPTDAAYTWTPQPHPSAAPPARTGDRRLLHRGPEYSRYIVPHFPVLAASGSDLWRLTTPVPYLPGCLPFDTFQAAGENFLYINLHDLGTSITRAELGHEPRYVLLSAGPATNLADETFPNPAKGPFMIYDPTNGTISRGNIIDFGDWTARDGR